MSCLNRDELSRQLTKTSKREDSSSGLTDHSLSSSTWCVAGVLSSQVQEVSSALQHAVTSMQHSLDAAASQEASSLDATILRLRHDQAGSLSRLPVPITMISNDQSHMTLKDASG